MPKYASLARLSDARSRDRAMQDDFTGSRDLSLIGDFPRRLGILSGKEKAGAPLLDLDDAFPHRVAKQGVKPGHAPFSRLGNYTLYPYIKGTITEVFC